MLSISSTCGVTVALPSRLRRAKEFLEPALPLQLLYLPLHYVYPVVFERLLDPLS